MQFMHANVILNDVEDGMKNLTKTGRLEAARSAGAGTASALLYNANAFFLPAFLAALRRILASHSREYIVPRHLGEPQ
jgi:hypothetical protein